MFLKEQFIRLRKTVAYNIDPLRRGAPRFQRLVSLDNMPADSLPNIEKEAIARLEPLTQEFDNFLSRENKKFGSEEGETQVGIGLYYYEVPSKIMADS